MEKVVVIGGGFAGSYAAKHLEKDFDVTLIDNKDFFEFTPSILRTLVEPKRISKIQVKHSSYLKKARIMIDDAVDVKNGEIAVASGKKIAFDYLVICSGSSYKESIKEAHVATTLRASHLVDFNSRLKEAKKILVIGGGLVGVELAGEICEAYRGKEITLLHSKGRLMERNNPKSQAYAERFLRAKGVKILLGERFTESKDKAFLTSKGSRIEADLAFLCTGIRPNFGFMSKNMKNSLNERNQIKVNRHLQVEGCSNIFAAGDVNDIKCEKTAQSAVKQAKVAVKNVRALSRSKNLHGYIASKTPLVISLGRYNAIFEYKNIVIAGKVPALMKFFIEKEFMMRHFMRF